MEPATPKKFNLEDKSNELKFYMFTVQKGPHFTIPAGEDFRVIMAYNHEDAIVEVKKMYKSDVSLVIMKRLELPLKKVIANLNLEQPAEQIHVEVTPEPSPQKKIENFVFNTMLLADEYVKDTKKRDMLKKILSEIKLNEDEPTKGTSNPETQSTT